MICHKNHLNLLHNPTLVMSSLLQILYIIPKKFLGTRLWVTVKCLDIHTSVWQPIKHPIPTCPFLVRFLPASVRLWCWSITDVWHFNHDTTIRLLSRIFVINVILSFANAFSNSPNNGSPSPIFSKSST